MTPQPHKRPRQFVGLPLRGPDAERALAIRHHPLAPGGRDRGREILTRDSTTTPATCSGHRPSVGSTAPTSWRPSTRLATLQLPGRPAHRQRRDVHLALRRRAKRVRTRARVAGHPPEQRPPDHPQTRGKMERFHQTLKKCLGQGPTARTVEELQGLFDTFRVDYNEVRPHRAIGRRTPGEAYQSDAQGAAGWSSRPGPPPPALRRRRRRASPCAGPAACTTSRSGLPMPGVASSPSSMSAR